MITIPEQASKSVRLAAIERRIIACQASATVLRCGGRELAAAQLQREIVQLQQDRAALLLRHAA